jgi:UDP-glucose 4-epimerase
MKCLVTGSAGFIGSHLCEALLQKGFLVTGVDDLSVGRLTNIDSIINNDNFTFMKCDISNSKDLNSIGNDFDYVFHLAALADIVPSIENPKRYFEVNVSGTVNLLEHCKNSNIKKFIYAASSSCYGIPDKYPTSENSDIRTEYPYAMTKHLGELCVTHWCKVYNMPFLSLRLFNVYGPRARTSGTYGAVFGVLLAQRANNKPLTIVGDGMQTRDFTFVTDVVSAFIAGAESQIKNVIFNVGSGGTYAINYLADLIGGPRIYIPKRPGEPECTFADIRQIKKELEWQPYISFEEGVKVMINNIEHWKDAPIWDRDSIGKATEKWFAFLDKKA